MLVPPAFAAGSGAGRTTGQQTGVTHEQSGRGPTAWNGGRSKQRTTAAGDVGAGPSSADRSAGLAICCPGGCQRASVTAPLPDWNAGRPGRCATPHRRPRIDAHRHDQTRRLNSSFERRRPRVVRTTRSSAVDVEEFGCQRPAERVVERRRSRCRAGQATAGSPSRIRLRQAGRCGPQDPQAAAPPDRASGRCRPRPDRGGLRRHRVSARRRGSSACPGSASARS